jgi:hypothetical protein
VFYTYTVAHLACARCSGLAWHARALFAVLTASAAAARLTHDCIWNPYISLYRPTRLIR